MKAYYQFHDSNDDGYVDEVLVLCKEFGREPLIGDYRGIRMAVIPFSSKEGERRAEELARVYCKALEKTPPYNINQSIDFEDD